LVADRLPKRTLAGIGRSLGRLSVDARHLVQVAAALGLRSRPRDLAGLLNTTVAQILPAVADALTHGLLNSDGEGLAFCHDLVRRAVADTVPASVRRALAEDADRIAQATPPPAAAAPGRMPPVQRHATPWDALAGPPSREPPSIPLRDSRGPVSSTAWASLTATEQLVAVLIGRALTNRQVATRLRVSPHTVNYHLRQIYRKLDINSRVHLARLVYDHLPEPPAAA
jgi:DNA-binding CsgD family transcriptional regulator